MQPRGQAYREAGWETSDDDDAYSNACRLERRPGVRERIAYLSRQGEELIAEKRRRIEEKLWNIHEAAIGDYLETVEIDGKIIERPKRISELPREVQQNIEKIAIDDRGRAVPQLYSNIGRTDDRSDLSRCCCQAAAGSTRPIPPLVHRIRGRPHRPRRGA